MRNVFLCFSAAVFFACLGCSPRTELSIAKNSALEFGFSVSMKGSAASIIDSFSAQNNTRFSAATLESNLKKYGFDSVSVTAAENTRIAFTAKAASAQKIFAAAPEAIEYSPAQGAKAGELTVTLSPKTMGEILALFPSSTIDFLSLFLSPLLTPGEVFDEVTDEKSYLDGIKIMYGANTADAIAESEFVFSFAAPGTIKTAVLPEFAKSSKSANKLTVRMPLAALLSLTKPVAFSINWN